MFYSYVLVFYPYVTGMYLVCTRMLLVCTRMYSYVTRMYLYVTRMYSCGVLVTIRTALELKLKLHELKINSDTIFGIS